MNKKYVVRLTSEERLTLQRLVSVGKAAARKILHARILLQADQGPAGPGWTDAGIAEALSAHARTIAGVRQRLVEQGLEAALNRKEADAALASTQARREGRGSSDCVAVRGAAPRANALDAPPAGRPAGGIEGRRQPFV
jgi:hypothetical protein